jgi:hypothetical protein
MSKRDQELTKLGNLTAQLEGQVKRIAAEAPRAKSDAVLVEANEALERALEILVAWEVP